MWWLLKEPFVIAILLQWKLFSDDFQRLLKCSVFFEVRDFLGIAELRIVNKVTYQSTLERLGNPKLSVKMIEQECQRQLGDLLPFVKRQRIAKRLLPMALEDAMRLPEWKLGSNNTCRNGNWVLISRNTRWRSKVNFLFSYRSESFPSNTFPFSLKKVRLGFQQFNKAQMSHRHATDAPPTHHRRILYVIRLNSGQRVGRQSTDSRPTRWPTCWPTRWWDRILNFYQLFLDDSL